jgi:hypothetical protein
VYFADLPDELQVDLKRLYYKFTITREFKLCTSRRRNLIRNFWQARPCEVSVSASNLLAVRLHLADGKVLDLIGMLF